MEWDKMESNEQIYSERKGRTHFLLILKTKGDYLTATALQVDMSQIATSKGLAGKACPGPDHITAKTN